MNVHDQLTNPWVIQRVNARLFELIEAHGALSRCYEGVVAAEFTMEQTAFISQSIGGPIVRSAAQLAAARELPELTPPLREARQELLARALNDAGAPRVLREAWLKIEDERRSPGPPRS